MALALGLVAVHTVRATNYTVGLAAGWNANGNFNYTAQFANYNVKVGDILCKSIRM